jgi:hypothetical protein
MVRLAGLSVLLALMSLGPAAHAGVPQPDGAVVVFHDAGFPASDSAPPTVSDLQRLLPDSRIVPPDRLSEALAESTCRLLVMPFGSSFPETAWEGIHSFLERGGNLLILGGRPFTRAAFKDGPGWHLRDYSVRFARDLLIDQYQETPGSDGLDFELNRDVLMPLPRFRWKRAFSPIVHLGGEGSSGRLGSATSLDARLEALAWGTKDARRLSAPALRVDHVRNRFRGGRWILLNAELDAAFYGSPDAQPLIRALADSALRGSEEFVARPTLPLYLPGEPIGLEVHWQGATRDGAALSVRITRTSEEQPQDTAETRIAFPPNAPVVLPAPATKGLHVIEAKLEEHGQVRAVYRSGIWIRDEAYLRSGSRLSVNRDFFELDGRPLAVVGTTYMASDVQRLFFDHPNVFVWDRDLAQIKGAGLNMLRTGWWTGWDKLCDEDGRPYERTLRTLEAYLMTARKHGLPVQFNLFAFLPDVLGGVNAYLDPESVRKQKQLVSSVVERFREVPFLAWDLINEPSWSRHLWMTRPNEDAIEAVAWNQWLAARYPHRAALAHAWDLPSNRAGDRLPVPSPADFEPQGVYEGSHPGALNDFYLFTQEQFVAWVQAIRKAIHDAGSRQLVTVGQDEGGIRDRLSPAFYGPDLDFTTNHSWWQNDSILWDSLAAKVPGTPLLIQETGIQRELSLDGISRRSPENEAALLERKVALAFVQGSGAIQWLWHTNAYMPESDEVCIGALRSDSTEKPEAAVMRGLAAFSAALGPHLREPEPASVAIVTSQAAQYSVLNTFQLQAQRKAVLASAYDRHVPSYVVAENQIARMGSPKLAILPSPQALNDETWQSLLAYVSSGGNLLITGPVERDRHWRLARRVSSLGLAAWLEPVTYRSAAIRLGQRSLSLVFDQEDVRSGGQSVLESLRFADGSSFKEIPYGRGGRVFWCAYPAELATGLTGASDLYSHVFEKLGIRPPFTSARKVPDGVLVYPVVLRDAVLYVMVSDGADDGRLDLRDKRTGARLTLTLRAQHAALALVRKSDGEIVARYGF